MTQLPQIPRYNIVRKIGSGGAADVYLAVQEPLNREVAIKVLVPSLFRDGQAARRFLREAETAAKLVHSNIVTIFDVGQSGDTYFIVMEYLPESLKDRIRRGPVEPTEALRVVAQVAGALAYAHEQGFIHRDVKPDNILFRKNGTLVLADFGIAKALEYGTKLTATGMSVGTPHYMSPEHARGKERDGRADIYSLGVVFYEMLTGNVPFEAENSVAVAIMHIQEPIPRLPADLARLQPLLDRMMAKERERRVQSGEELARLVKELGGGAGQRGVSTDARRIPEHESAAGQQVFAEEARRIRGDQPLGGQMKPKPVTIAGEAELGGPDEGAGSSGKQRPRREIVEYGTEEESTSKKSKNKSRTALIAGLGGALVVAVGLLIVLLSNGDRKSGVESSRPTAAQTWRGVMPDIEFVWVPAGEFDMGSNNGDSDEKPVHRVYVDGLWMGKHEVTQGMWQAVMGSNPAHFKKGDIYPVEQVSWEDSQEFIRRLNSRTGMMFRLPSEAEWEFACRAGTTGDSYGNLSDITWHNYNSIGSTHPVGQKMPNALGLYDMLGNVWELCQDWFGDYSNGYERNPTGLSSGSGRVGRGGSWGERPQDIRASIRREFEPSSRPIILGFRLVRTK